MGGVKGLEFIRIIKVFLADVGYVVEEGCFYVVGVKLVYLERRFVL